MRSILYKLIMVLVLLAGWVTYDNWGKIASFSPSSVKTAVINSFSFATSGLKKSRIYQWEDENGRKHVSNTPPVNARNVKVVEYESDLNVVPGHKPAPEDKKQAAGQDSTAAGDNASNIRQPNTKNNNSNKDLVDTYTSAIKDAKDVQNIMNQRNKNLTEQLSQ